MRELQIIAQEATEGIGKVLGGPLKPKQAEAVANIVEEAVIKALLEGQHRAVDTCLTYPKANRDIAHKIASAIRQKNDALIVNLTSLR
ncbi:MAG: hypothetical protein ACTSUD_01655 [Alphaproteobacteria bacterium]